MENRVRQLEAEARHKNAQFRYAIVVLVVCFTLLVVVGYIYTNKVQRDSNQKLCGLFNAVYEPAPANAAPRIKKVQAELANIRKDFGCEKEGR